MGNRIQVERRPRNIEPTRAAGSYRSLNELHSLRGLNSDSIGTIYLDPPFKSNRVDNASIDHAYRYSTD